METNTHTKVGTFVCETETDNQKNFGKGKTMLMIFKFEGLIFGGFPQFRESKKKDVLEGDFIIGKGNQIVRRNQDA